MKKLLAAVVLVVIAGGADSPTLTPDKKEPSKSLKVGDAAPALKASKWLQGEEVKQFEPGKVYVVEFWATWCGLCIHFMPHTAELQARYGDQGVAFIAFSAAGPDNTQAKVAAFVKKRGPRLPFTFAYADDRTTYDAWMTAAGREGIPCVFVVDKAGRIAYIGHPLYLSVVLPKVVAGNMNAQTVSDQVHKIEEEHYALALTLPRDPKAGLKALADFETKYPLMANNPVFVKPKLSQLPRVGEVEQAKRVAEAVVAKAIKGGDPSALRQVAALLRNGPGKESKELLAVAVKAAEAAVQVVGDNDAQALIELASTYYVAGDKVKARECAQKAVEAAAGESATLKQAIEEQAKKMFDDNNK